MNCLYNFLVLLLLYLTSNIVSIISVVLNGFQEVCALSVTVSHFASLNRRGYF